ncbi:MAG: hypothetical protein EOO89_18420 [Pedobacter sp.]|nr:MAG: hypothetical protein EOO89_18420 [Pedobacter sp.]
MRVKNTLRTLALVSLLTTSLTSCEKDEQTPGPMPSPETPVEVNYLLINKSIQVTDTSPLSIDANGDGKIDIYFYVVDVFSEGISKRYFGLSTLGNNAVLMGAPNDDEFLNVADVPAFKMGEKINTASAGLEWSGDNGVLAIKRLEGNGANWVKNWSSGNEFYLGFKLQSTGAGHYGWIKVRIDKATEKLQVIDLAWNKKGEEGLKAG